MKSGTDHVLRLEGAEKVTGRARYAGDQRLPGVLYARIVRSTLPHARVLRVDTTAAEALGGVRAVLSSANSPDISWHEDSRLFDQTVRYIGDEVAALAADSEELAEDAARLVRIEYLPLAFDAIRPEERPEVARPHRPARSRRADRRALHDADRAA